MSQDHPSREDLMTLSRELVGEGVGSLSNEGIRDYIATLLVNDAALERVIRAFELFAPYLPDNAVTLDWGCRHALDSCLMRRWLGPGAELHGCDIADDDFSVFHNYAGLKFSHLKHVWELPYEDETFDVVLSSGVLEHVSNEYESIKEVWRILKPSGIFAVTFLPNIMSASENIIGILKPEKQHKRLYQRARTRSDFLRRGFLVEDSGYHQVFPTLTKGVQVGGGIGSLVARLSTLNRPAEKIWPIRVLASNLYFILRKVDRF
jgi:SAM-dependent methyltransferase